MCQASLLSRTGCATALEALGEQADARLDGVSDATKYLEALRSRAARRRRIGQLPAKLQSAARRDRAARVAHRNDDVPGLAHSVHGFARLLRDVDPDLAHRRDRQRMDARGAGAGALHFEPIGSEGTQEPLGHLRAGGVLRTKKEHALHDTSMTRGAETRSR